MAKSGLENVMKEQLENDGFFKGCPHFFSKEIYDTRLTSSTNRRHIWICLLVIFDHAFQNHGKSLWILSTVRFETS